MREKELRDRYQNRGRRGFSIFRFIAPPTEWHSLFHDLVHHILVLKTGTSTALPVCRARKSEWVVRKNNLEWEFIGQTRVFEMLEIFCIHIYLSCSTSFKKVSTSQSQLLPPSAFPFSVKFNSHLCLQNQRFHFLKGTLSPRNRNKWMVAHRGCFRRFLWRMRNPKLAIMTRNLWPRN